MADVYFRAQRLAGNAVYADFVPNLAGVVQASGSVAAQDASTTGQIATFADVTVTGVVTGQPANTTGVTNTLTPETATGAVQGQEASTTGQILAVAPTPVDVTGTVQGQSAIASGIVVVSTPAVTTATGDAQASPATTTGQVLPFGTMTATGAVQAQPATTTGKSGLFKDHSPVVQMKLPDGTWIPINDDMHWMGLWVPGTTYVLNDTTRDGDWTMIANKETLDRPAPQPIGPVEDNLPVPETWDADQSHVGVVTTGHAYTFIQGGWVTQIDVYVPEVTAFYTFQLRIINNTDPTNPTTLNVNLPPLTPDAWTTVTLLSELVKTGTELIFVLDMVNSLGVTPWGPFNWDTGAVDNNNGPAAQQWNRNQQHTLLRISDTDNGATDQSTNLALLIAGSDIRIEQANDATRYLVYHTFTITDQTTYFDYAVSLTETGPGGEPLVGQSCVFTASIPQPSTTLYARQDDYFLTNGEPSWCDITGFLQFDGVPQTGDDNDLYGVNVYFQDASVSPDWELVANSGGGTGGSSAARGLTVQEQRWISANSSPFELYQLTTVDGLDMEIGRRTIPDPSGHKGGYLVQGRRVDGIGYFWGEYSALIWNDVGADVNLVVKVEESTQPTLRFEIETDVNDIVYEVRGFAGQTWEWKVLEFYGDIG